MQGILVALLLVAACATARELPSDRSTAPVKVADVPSFCEGVVIDRSGTIGFRCVKDAS